MPATAGIFICTYSPKHNHISFSIFSASYINTFIAALFSNILQQVFEEIYHDTINNHSNKHSLKKLNQQPFSFLNLIELKVH